MGILFGFAPWIVFWILVGNVPVLAAVLVALGVAVGALVIGRLQQAPGQTIEIGAVGTFVVLTVVAMLASEPALGRWILPLSAAGAFLVALFGALLGKPFIREFVEPGLSADVLKNESFGPITTRVTWIWVATFAGMTVSSSIPPIVRGDASMFDTETPLAFILYWVVPAALLGLATLASRIPFDQLVPGIDDVRKTTFVAFVELAIDELYYLAQKHANREVGAGQEAYDVRVGGKGVPLVGDESRSSWPATYKVRERRH